MKRISSFIGLALTVSMVHSQDPAPTTPTPAAKTEVQPANPAPAGTTPAPGAAAPAPATESRKTTSLDSLFKLVPIGRTHRGVRYPVMEQGQMSSMVTSERMTRLDENSLLFEEAVIDQRGNDPLTFHLQHATYNRASELLHSTQPARIESRAYQIEGDSMTYDRKTSVARMDGRVRMVIFDVSSVNPAAATEEPTVEGQPATGTAPAKPGTPTPAAAKPVPAQPAAPTPAAPAPAK